MQLQHVVGPEAWLGRYDHIRVECIETIEDVDWRREDEGGVGVGHPRDHGGGREGGCEAHEGVEGPHLARGEAEEGAEWVASQYHSADVVWNRCKPWQCPCGTDATAN